ncbi:unnamed protein product [Caenorhabditis bovis]|uniref:AMP-dependent synthetase/ligase domain-containing protein n=1 Tax=Caenorhabditis bovis TaxID=2654633 RepID=A0A8S1ETH8_9PELO|nr:unnamed protein product [Caenorhabditis bovis]
MVNNSQLLLCENSIFTESEMMQCSNAYVMPAFLSRLSSFDCFQNVERIQYGGEALNSKTIEQLIQTYPKLQLYQEYGLTEQSVYSTSFRVESVASYHKDLRACVCLVHENKLTLFYIANRNLPDLQWLMESRLPSYMIPKNFIKIDGFPLTRTGKIDRKNLLDALTKRENHYFSEKRAWYNTGDQCSFDKTGSIIFKGRNDYQIKMRGYRVDLVEIEKVIESHRNVILCQAIYNTEMQSITAYYIGSADKDEIKKYCAKMLETYKVPSRFMRLNEFPYTKNSKIDRSALAQQGDKIYYEKKNSGRFLFIGASSGGTFAYSTSLLFEENFTIDIALIDSGTFYHLIEKLNFDEHKMELVKNLKEYDVDAVTLEEICQRSWKTLQLLKFYEPVKSDKPVYVLSIDGSDLGWKNIAVVKKVLQITGSHYTMLTEDKNVENVLEAILNILRNLQSKSIK